MIHPTLPALAEFLRALVESGEIRLELPQTVEPAESEAAFKIVEEFESDYRNELAGNPPDVERGAAMWAAQSFFRAAQFIVYRDVDEKTVVGAFEQITETVEFKRSTPSAHYSVDLIFRFLPDLWKFAKGNNRDDPVCDGILRWAVEWPLSSVGMELESRIIDDTKEGGSKHRDQIKNDASNIEPETNVTDVASDRATLEFDISGFAEHKSLMQLYVDRIIELQDLSRTNDPRVIEEVKRSIGLHSHLAGTKLKELVNE